MPIDPWAYTDLKERGFPRWSEEIRYYELDTEGFATAVAEVMVEKLSGSVLIFRTLRAAGPRSGG